MNEVTTTNYNNEQLALIKETVAKGATDNELKLFLYRCKNMGLDPLKPGQIFFIKYGDRGTGSIVVGIDGFRSAAARSGQHSGTKRGLTYSENGDLIGAWAEVYRRDWQHPAKEEVLLSEYSTGKAMWAKMPATMIKKVAEVAALRMAFPDELGGVYSDDEMQQATPAQIVQPEPIKHTTGPSPEAVKAVFDAAIQHGWTKFELTSLLEREFKVKSTSELNKQQWEELISLIAAGSTP